MEWMDHWLDSLLLLRNNSVIFLLTSSFIILPTLGFLLVDDAFLWIGKDMAVSNFCQEKGLLVFFCFASFLSLMEFLFSYSLSSIQVAGGFWHFNFSFRSFSSRYFGNFILVAFIRFIHEQSKLIPRLVNFFPLRIICCCPLGYLHGHWLRFDSSVADLLFSSICLSYFYSMESVWCGWSYGYLLFDYCLILP
jgi:hypothetical protein